MNWTDMSERAREGQWFQADEWVAGKSLRASVKSNWKDPSVIEITVKFVRTPLVKNHKCDSIEQGKEIAEQIIERFKAETADIPSGYVVGEHALKIYNDGGYTI